MQIYYNNESNEIILNKKSHDPETFSNRGYFEDRFPLGYLLMEFIELDFNEITKTVNELSLKLPKKEIEIKNNLSKVNNVYEKLTRIHPYFWDVHHDIKEALEWYEYLSNQYVKYKELSSNNNWYKDENIVTSLCNDDTELEIEISISTSPKRGVSKYTEALNKRIKSLSIEIDSILIIIKKELNYYKEVHEKFKKIVDFCLSAEGPKELKDLSPLERYYLYQLVYDTEIKENMLGVLYKVNSIEDEDDITIEIDKTQLCKVLDLLPKKPIIIYEVYESNVRGACYLEFIKLVSQNTLINKCKNCGKYFISKGRVDALYCDRLIDNEGKTCKDVGAMNSYRERIKDDPVMYEYNKIYKRYSARVRYKKMSQEDFYNWSEVARDMRDKAREGKITLEEFKEWLENN